MSEQKRTVTLPGSERMMVPGARFIRAAHDHEGLEVTVRLRRRTPLPSVDDLGLLPVEQRRHLTREEFQATYGADPEDVDQVESFATSFGLRLQGRDPARRSVVLSGTVADFNRAFSTRLMHYDHPNGAFRGRVGALSVPAELADVVTGVFGLDTHRLVRLRPRPRPLSVSQAHVTSGLPTGFPIPELATLYSFPAGDGEGQSIGLLEFGGGYYSKDVEQNSRLLGLPVPEVVPVTVDGVNNRPSMSSTSEAGQESQEVELDIEVVAALVPRARLAVYFSDFTEKGWVDALSAAIHDTVNKPTVLSISWGYAENQYIWTAACMDEVNAVLQEAAVLGITVCVASGDDGSEDGALHPDGQAHVDFPASSPYVLAVGGTTLNARDGAILEEKVWNNGPQSLPGGGAGGGGISAYFAQPSWQENANVPSSVNPGHKPGRGVPDVAANADPNTGYSVVSQGKQFPIGGTSAAAPLWAGLIARLNQQLGKPLGYLNPLLYATLGKACNDITVGNNDPTGHIGGYAAVPGWDACTGWGSPNGQLLLAALREPPSQA